MKKVLYVFHQKTSVAGDVGNKFKERGFSEEIVRPPLGDILPEDLTKYLLTMVQKFMMIMLTTQQRLMRS